MTSSRLALFALGTLAALSVTSADEPPAPVKAHTAIVHGVAVSPDGTLLATAGFDNLAKIWEIGPAGTLKEKKVLTGHSAPVYAVAFHPTDPKVLATASQDKTARLWDIEEGKMKVELKGHTDIVDTIAFSPDGKSLATASADKTVRLWNPADGKELKNLGAHDGSVYSIAFSPDGKLLASAGSGKDNLVKIWDVKEQKALTQLKGHEQPVTSVVFAGNDVVVTTSMDRTIRVWTTTEPKEVKDVKDTKDTKDSTDSKDLKKDTKEPKDAKDPKEPKKDGKDVKDSKEPKKDAKEPKDVKDPKELKKLGPTADDPYAIAWSEKTKTAGVCGYSGRVTLWAIDQEKPKLTRAIKSPGYCIAFSADGKFVFTGHDNGTVAVTPTDGK
jgi:WD40 repeat protein